MKRAMAERIPDFSERSSPILFSGRVSFQRWWDSTFSGHLVDALAPPCRKQITPHCHPANSLPLAGALEIIAPPAAPYTSLRIKGSTIPEFGVSEDALLRLLSPFHFGVGFVGLVRLLPGLERGFSGFGLLGVCGDGGCIGSDGVHGHRCCFFCLVCAPCFQWKNRLRFGRLRASGLELLLFERNRRCLHFFQCEF